MQDAAYVRNCDVTYGGKTPLEIATGRPPPDVIQIENMDPGNLSQDETNIIRAQQLRMQLAQEAHLQARQRLDLRRDLAAKLLPSHGPLQVGEAVWYWARDMSKIRGGQWIKAKILSTEVDSPMVRIQLTDCSPDHRRQFWVNRSLIRKNPDPWHDVIIPGLD